MIQVIVSFKIAKLAKSKGYPQDDGHGYTDKRKLTSFDTENNRIIRSAPTQSQLQKWLRDDKGIHLSIWNNALTKKWRIDYIEYYKTDKNFIFI